MLKVLKIASLVLFLGLLSIEVYWCFSYRGNLTVYVQNQSETSRVIEVKISLDGDQIFNGRLNSDEIIPHALNLHKRIGGHNLSIWRADTDETIEVRFNLFLVKWVVIDIYTDTTIIGYELIPPLFQ